MYIIHVVLNLINAHPSDKCTHALPMEIHIHQFTYRAAIMHMGMHVSVGLYAHYDGR